MKGRGTPMALTEACLELGGFECVYIFSLHMYPI